MLIIREIILFRTPLNIIRLDQKLLLLVEKRMNSSEIQIFKSKDGKTEIQVKLENETIWLNQY